MAEKTWKDFSSEDWQELLEFHEFKLIEKETLTPLSCKNIIMTGGQVPMSKEDLSKRYWKNIDEDPRKTGLKDGLRQLTAKQLRRVIDYPGEMVLDTYNYQDGKFCALAIGVGLDLIVDNPTHQKIHDILHNMGYRIYNTRGISGNFYTTNRKEDLLAAAKEVLQEKLDNNSNGNDR